ncbi:cyclase family protein [Snuella sedimenti]|uniref:Cyclase family protein n=1 Tax=Snuella sedimenti TaxID=2798802 RepID=A0A8J7IFE4_9FLAO|nr:cyclase family protein [Snuella sedimenti]MBJ6367742.1 cyclase family protein [Snuella sedimenti]
MLATIQYRSKKLQVDLSKPIDISIPMQASKKNVNAWYLDPPKIEPVKDGDWIASVKEGASINFNNIHFNPHAHGTHTECVGHITETLYSVNKELKQFFFLAEVITVAPEKLNDDFVISKKQLQFAIGNKKRDAIIIRTIPNTKEKLSAQYSHTNPPYLLEDAAVYLREKGIQHLLIDLPSIDKEKDDGKLLAHRAFWNVGGSLRKHATITEFIFVPNSVVDGIYILNLQIAPFNNDATPSKPILYKIENL